MKLTIREMEQQEYALLDDFLYEAIFIPEGASAPPRSITSIPELKVYTENFGAEAGDTAYVAEVDMKVVGVVWCRIMNDYGHIDDETPSLAMSLLPEYRGKGIGTKLLSAFLDALKHKGCSQISLSVQKQNYAFGMYRKAGFQIVSETDEEYIMVIRLSAKRKEYE